ncbi:ABC-2 type transporter-domain-containing protein [Mycena maculata]|uniref:ABC-2 type transporter-domain-containing protein n=1 Tax=Mycena maculata TaxID=230809 RepID=A0AAD7J7L7_9AGAR|nr:ABC-2 type transporter-domain-containing protein [Mycena maculata]
MESPKSIALDAQQEERVHALARSMSLSESVTQLPTLAQTTTRLSQHINPFEDTQTDPALDPRSESFDINAWLKSVMHIASRDPENFPTRTAGVSFRNLNVHGVGSPTDYQKTIGNVWLGLFSTAKGWLGMGTGKRNIQILRDFDGLLKSGELLVVLGRPGSGCSTFLKTISGQTHGFTVAATSDIQYQGIPREIMHNDFRGEVIYNAETDVHFPNLTVGQTLLFAAKARVPRTRFGGVPREAYAAHLRDLVMAIFGLGHTLDTKVGNDFVRGVSGGERKRVSIAETTLSGSPLQCWDNSTRGLDSATALDFIRTLRLSTQVTGATCMVAIYQASQNAYDLFDKALVLYEGRQIYYGPTDRARAFWTARGFVCPPRQTTGDFLTSLTNPAERVVAAGFERRAPRTPDEFARVWRESAEHGALLREIAAYNAAHPLGGAALASFRTARQLQQSRSVSARSPYTISVRRQIALCMERGFQRLAGDLTNFYVTVFGNFVMALLISSVFYNLKDDTASFYSRGALLFYAVILNAFASALEIFTLYAQRPIVEKHNAYALYHPFAEAISSMICDLPAKMITGTVVNMTLYFMTNLRRTPGAFFTFYLFSMVCTLTMSMIFRTIAATSRSLVAALTPAAIFILGLIMYTGFTVPVRDMVVWFRWLNYINPVGYVFEALMVNEFAGRVFPCGAFVPAGAAYADVAAANRICATTGARAGLDYVLGADYVAVSFSYVRSHLWRNLGIVLAFMAVFCAAHLLATEYISAAKSRGEVLVFARGHLRVARRGAHDEETSTLNEKPIGDAPAARAEDVKIPPQKKIFLWKDVCYDIRLKDGSERRLLDRVDGWVRPGTLTALMVRSSLSRVSGLILAVQGVSGAGKTTLLDVLATRTTMGIVTGDMLVNGRQRDQSFQRKTGYVQQQDLHLATSTVRESLVFSALLRQHKSVPRAEKLAYVEEVIALLEMESYASAVVGVPGEGLNVEQRKRLTIAVELVAKPELLVFFDEPTSGLDSQTAWSICQLMRKLADHGQAILSTIHQPSAILMQEFDRLLFLAPGGKTVYFGEIGENSKVLTGYFEKYGAHPCPPEANPAEWMLEVIGAARGHKSILDWPEVWKTSEERVQIRKQFDDMVAELSQIEDAGDSAAGYEPFAMPLSTQLYECLKRVWLQYWRTPSYIYSKLTLVTLCSLFIGFTFYQAHNDLQGLQDQLFSIFMLLILFGNLTQQIMPLFVEQRALYEARERPSKAYSWVAFVVAQILVEIPWQTLAALLIFVSWYYPIGLYRNAMAADQTAERGGLMFLFILQFMLFTSTFGQMLVAGSDTAEAAGNAGNLLFSLTLLFCGVLVAPRTLGWWIWMYRVSPFSYLVGGMLATGVANTEVVCSSIEILVVDPIAGQTCGQYFAPYIAEAGGNILNPNATSGCEFCTVAGTNVFLAASDIFYSQRWRNFGILWVYICFNASAALFFYWLNRVPKDKKTKKPKKTVV